MTRVSFIADWRRLQTAAAIRREQAYRPGTTANHRSVVLLFLAFTIYFRAHDFPASTGVLLLFGEFLLRSYRAHKSVMNALSSLRTFHQIHGFDTSGFLDFQFTLFRKALPLTVRHLPSPSPPLPLELLQHLCEWSVAQGGTGRVFAALLSTLFFSMARLSSLLPRTSGPYDNTRLPTWADLRWEGDRFLLLIKWGKCTQDAAAGYWVPLLRQGTAASCPVHRLQDLAFLLNSRISSTPLFAWPQASATSSHPGGFFTFVSAKRWLDRALLALGLSQQGYTFRRGACTRAFQGGGRIDGFTSTRGLEERCRETLLSLPRRAH